MSVKKTILMLGPGRDGRGGITTLVNIFLKTELSELYNIIYLKTQCEGTRLDKFFCFLNSFFKFLYIILFKKIDLVHIHCASRASFYRKGFLFFLAKIFNKKVIFHINGAEFITFYYQESPAFQKWIIRKVLLKSDCVLAISNQWKEDLEGIIEGKRNVDVLFNPITIPHISRNTHKRQEIHILSMGFLCHRKGTYDVLEAASRISEKIPNVKFCLYGDGNNQEMKSLVKKLKLQEHVTMPGWVQDKEKAYLDADIYVLPSYNEGLPLSVLEAASYQLPIVTTPVGGIPEIIEDGKNGFLIEPGNVDMLEQRLMELIQSQELRQKMAEGALITVQTHFEASKIADSLDKIYCRLIKRLAEQII